MNDVRIPRWSDIALVNNSTDFVVTDEFLHALQVQYGRDLAPAWGTWGDIDLVPADQIPDKRMVLGIFDTADQAYVLGYHDITPSGLPVGKVFVETSRANNASISVVTSHEMCEMVVNPFINRMIQDLRHPFRFWISEVCDAVEADEDGYAIEGVQVSNFVLPSYFNDLSGPWDQVGLLTGPLPTLRPGGYLSYIEHGMWHQIYGRNRAARIGKFGGSGRLNRVGRQKIISTFNVIRQDVQAP
jgi:hypothetical protein